MREFFTDKNILISGTTGFVGKVLLEKILRTIPRIGKIFLLIRSKPKFTLQQRMFKEIFKSELFIPLFKERPELVDIIKEKVIPINGDLVIEGLGLDPVIRATLCNEVEIILNTAASINFNDPIRDALQINYYGAERMLALAHDCKNLIAIHHVSTIFVNTNLPYGSVIDEEIYPFKEGVDWEEFVFKLSKMEPQDLEREEPNILKEFNFPNTYTLTKSLAEKAFQKKRKNLRVSITRPAIITACVKYPFIGWTDSIAAAGAIAFQIGMGISNVDLNSEDVPGAFIPCDYSVNAIMLATAMSAMLPTPSLTVYQVTATINNVTQSQFFKSGVEYLQNNPWSAAIAPYKKIQNETTMKDFKRKSFFNIYLQDLKIKALSLPYVGNKKAIKLEKKKLKMMYASYGITANIVGYFRLKKEMHRVEKLIAMSTKLNKEEAELFEVDVRKLDLIFHGK